MRTVPIQAVVSRIKSKFGIEMDIYDVFLNSLEVLKQMKMYALDYEIITGSVRNFTFKLQDNAVKINWIIYLENLYNSNLKLEIQDIWLPPQVVFRSHNETEETTYYPLAPTEWQLNTDLDVKGPYIDYKWDCPFLKFDVNEINIACKYSKIRLDKDGFVAIPEQALEACVYYSVYSHMEPAFLVGKVPPAIFMEVKQWMKDHRATAQHRKMVDDFSQNEVNKVLDVMSSFDRKRFGIDA